MLSPRFDSKFADQNAEFIPLTLLAPEFEIAASALASPSIVEDWVALFISLSAFSHAWRNDPCGRAPAFLRLSARRLAESSLSTMVLQSRTPLLVSASTGYSLCFTITVAPHSCNYCCSAWP